MSIERPLGRDPSLTIFIIICFLRLFFGIEGEETVLLFQANKAKKKRKKEILYRILYHHTEYNMILKNKRDSCQQRCFLLSIYTSPDVEENITLDSIIFSEEYR